MSFVHEHEKPDETIAAICTPLGEGGVAMIRISGKEAVCVANRIFSGDVQSFASHSAHYGKIVSLSREVIDDVLLLPMLAPHSYTGENTVEIFCHGGGLIARRVLEVIFSAGARAAKPGEFTYRSFLNGKLDLAQAEAVQSVIAAKNERALDAAEKQLQGALSEKILHFQKKLTHIAAILEAWVDFPEEGLEFASTEEVVNELDQIANAIQKLLSTYHDGKIIHEGISLCLAGSPNVGKSSLMNRLLDRDRAIVSDIPGTTRDLLEDHLRLGDLNFRLTDTAGIRESKEQIEQEGIRRSKLAVDESDIVLLVLDIQKGVQPSDQMLLQTMPQQKTLVAWNKTDLPHSPPPSLPCHHVVPISAKSGCGIAELRKAINEIVWEKGPPSKEEVLITNVRHKEALEEAHTNCQAVKKGLQKGVSAEFIAMDMRQTLKALGRIIGTDITEEVLSSIFANFCVGK